LGRPRPDRRTSGRGPAGLPGLPEAQRADLTRTVPETGDAWAERRAEEPCRRGAEERHAPATSPQIKMSSRGAKARRLGPAGPTEGGCGDCVLSGGDRLDARPAWEGLCARRDRLSRQASRARRGARGACTLHFGRDHPRVPRSSSTTMRATAASSRTRLSPRATAPERGEWRGGHRARAARAPGGRSAGPADAGAGRQGELSEERREALLGGV
jgi:hypothetical protein